MRSYRRSWLSEIPDWKLQAFALTLAFLGALSKAIPEYFAFFNAFLKH